MKSIKHVVSPGDIQYFNEKGKRHRLDGPAVIWPSGNKYWFLNGKQHRLDGPAIEFASGTKYWFLNGIYYTEEEFNNMILTHWKRYYSIDSL